MFLYPLTITLILLCLFGRFFDYDQRVLASVTLFTIVPAAADFINALPEGVRTRLHGDVIIRAAQHLPFFSIGMGWVLPAVAGFLVGLLLRTLRKKTAV